MRMTVIGCGYLGVTHAACMAELGHEVLGLEVDAHRANSLNEGELPFYEPDLEPMLRKQVESGRLRFASDYAHAIDYPDVHFLCVGTPSSAQGGRADLSYLYSALELLADHLAEGSLVVGKSTVPVGTAHDLQSRLDRGLGMAGSVEVAWNPEFLREGHAVQDSLRPDRLVFGVRSERAEVILRGVYQDLLDRRIPAVVTDLPTAELIKVSANAFLATKISFINAVADVCDRSEADVAAVAEALGYDDRIGRPFLSAGLGFGGGCLPKDIRAFMNRAQELDAWDAVALLRQVETINSHQREKVVELARRLAGGSLAGARIAALGAAFKPNTDDVRDSPALDVAGRLHAAGAEIRLYDPQALDKARAVYPDLSYAESIMDACHDADLTLLLTEWHEFLALDPAIVGRIVSTRQMIDARNALDLEKWRASGWSCYGLGRASQVPLRAQA